MTADDNRPGRSGRQRVGRRVRIVAGAVVVLMVIATTSVLVAESLAHQPAPHPAATATPVAAAAFTELSEARIEALPEARYNAVIAGLIPYSTVEVPAASAVAYTISTDIPIYDADHQPVARFAFTTFTGKPTVIVPVRIAGPWALVMTPARRTLPSQSNGDAPAQTAGWVRTSELRRLDDIHDRIVISVSRQTLSIETADGKPVQSFPVAVGAPTTPTPTGVTGYLQERYLDPSAGEATYPIQLTSLHATTQDEPFMGEDGGLIGIHYFPVHSGSVSHGCVRLPEDAIRAVDALPLGTSVTMLP